MHELYKVAGGVFHTFHIKAKAFCVSVGTCYCVVRFVCGFPGREQQRGKFCVTTPPLGPDRVATSLSKQGGFKKAERREFLFISSNNSGAQNIYPHMLKYNLSRPKERSRYKGQQWQCARSSIGISKLSGHSRCLEIEKTFISVSQLLVRCFTANQHWLPNNTESRSKLLFPTTKWWGLNVFKYF